MTANVADLDPLVWSTTEAARLLGVSTNTIHTLIRRGDLKVIRIGVRGVKIPKRALAEFIEQAAS